MPFYLTYLLIVNTAGFFLILFSQAARKNVNALATIVCIMGGSLGVLIPILLFDRKPSKENMMSRVAISCIFLVQLLILIYIRYADRSSFTIAFWKLFERYPALGIWMIVINGVTFAAFGLDKFLAVTDRRRIPIVTLLGMVFTGGSVGALSAMVLFRHKIRKDYFAVGVPMILRVHILLFILLQNVL